MNDMKNGILSPAASKALAILLAILCFFVFAKTINAFKEGELIGLNTASSATIVVAGKGEVVATPDVAVIDFSVTEDAKTAADAQKQATDHMNKVLDFIKTKGIADKDVKTTDYSLSPKYDYQQAVCSVGYCPPGKSVLTGYTVSQSIEVKVRKTDQAGDILSGIGALNVQNISGISFQIDNPDSVNDAARTKAIADARGKADELARELGVKIVRIISYNENGQTPIYYAKTAMMDLAGAAAPAAPSVQVPMGENKITSNVSVTYEIR